MDNVVLSVGNDQSDTDTIQNDLPELDSDEEYYTAVHTNDQGVQELEITVRPTSKSFIGDNTVLVSSLTQAQTALFEPGFVQVQVNWKTSDGTRHATDIVEIPSFDNLYDEEL